MNDRERPPHTRAEENGRCGKTIGRHFQDTAHGEQAAARDLRTEGDLSQVLAHNIVDTVVICESLIQE